MKDPKLLDLYSDYLLSSFRMVTATGMSELLDHGISHDKISRFLGQEALILKTTGVVLNDWCAKCGAS
ncbi:MAG: hypothetical protein R2795_17830 [Saprospiraceae bacterium]